MVIGAEKFRASVAPPLPGRSDEHSQHVDPVMGSMPVNDLLAYLKENEDEDFFHVTCHIDSKLKQKISKGEYVDLEVLIPKSRSQMAKEDDRLQQYVTKGGSTYWAPPERENRINNIRKWEQAFRVYAAVYCQANPNRSTEIWQYVHIINTAAVSFAWENVMYYDTTFRQLMAQKPLRSWGKIYSQLWHTAMCDPLPKIGSSNTGNSGQFASRHTDWKDRCCWRFNRGGKCKKWNCAFDHRCSHCGGYNHNAKICNKRKGSSNYSRQERSRSRSKTPRGSGKKRKAKN